MKELYIVRKLCYVFARKTDIRMSLMYSFKLYERNTSPKVIWRGIFFLDEIENYDEIIENICKSNAQAILHARSENDSIADLCRHKLEYSKQIKIYYEPDDL